MADSYNKKERDKKKRKRKQEKAERRKQRKLEGTKQEEFMYVDENGNLTTEPPDPSKKKEIKLEDIAISTPIVTEEESSDKEGLVKFFNEEKHFGFITLKGTKIDYFVHGDSLMDPIRENDKVTFELESGPKGLVAVNVKLIAKK